MSPQLVLIKLKLRLNKLASNDYDNIEDWKAMEAVNKALVEWYRRQIHGANRTQEGDEETRVRVDDLQQFLIEKKVAGTNNTLYFQSELLPSNYLWFKKILPQCKKGACQGVLLESILIEEANVPEYLFDWNMNPSFEWRETFHTIIGNKIRVYTSDEFEVENIKLTYYRTPNKVDIAGYTHESGIASKDTDLEVKDDVAELILDDAVAILAADIEYFAALQSAGGRAEKNN